MVSMQDTPGLASGSLPFAKREVDMLNDLCPQLQLTPVRPLQQKEHVLAHLPMCKLFHFAGHGSANLKDPSRSCLLLEDWETNPLTMADVRDSRLHEDPPFLAYLSACSTGANKAIPLADEGIHLVSAFQLAGFRHVIGTLWEVSDRHCVDIARILYKTLQEEGMTDIAVSRGLHRAIRMLRDGRNKDDSKEERDAKLLSSRPLAPTMDYLWVPYVHFGV
ncbi:CHAT domain-containing protein [Trichoderma sp. SZMC 28011]